jgi:carboxymethylenebutenolidase
MKVRVIGSILLLAILAAVPMLASGQDVEVESSDVEVMSGELTYLSYLAAPTSGGPYPGIVLIHSFRGLEEGYRTMVDQLAGEGFVVLAVGWQTFEQSPADDVVSQLLDDSVAFLTARDDVDPERLGLTGFCAGGRYTMLFLPQHEAFGAGVAWYGFPYNGEPAPAHFVADFSAPMLMIHGTADTASAIGDIYRYSTDLQNAGAYFELKVYYGEPHGFMLEGGQLRTDEVAQDAFNEMADFFHRKLGAEM